MAGRPTTSLYCRTTSATEGPSSTNRSTTPPITWEPIKKGEEEEGDITTTDGHKQHFERW